ncbi:hypothetical protein [Pseudobacteriovorax antillogorgiicola]|uniref:Uncharacterized protein n=1 Tax=Pseudobacteriovorax antillogorgiicola TaxID=1513793 RepID=A0A1Y6BHA3_9BACT|nr:hypothetical protein [Pseudobacteriovorax antillogorgiicola]TCS55542.1 hypothetical protein EDD56_105265 [Pseudobacteriovorax antillogorgiicola]SMF11176.1 hypothetical protein SAMN06296036_10559 [Pseudobacteriovorax antillogorgiicola]
MSTTSPSKLSRSKTDEIWSELALEVYYPKGLLDPVALWDELSLHAGATVVAITNPFQAHEIKQTRGSLSDAFLSELESRQQEIVADKSQQMAIYNQIFESIYKAETRYSSQGSFPGILVKEGDSYWLYRYLCFPEFLSVELLEPSLRVLDQALLTELKRTPRLDMIQEHLPLDHFKFKGFSIWTREPFDLFRFNPMLARQVAKGEAKVMDIVLSWLSQDPRLKAFDMGIGVIHNERVHYFWKRSHGASKKGRLQTEDVFNENTESLFQKDGCTTLNHLELVGTYAWLDTLNKGKKDMISLLPMWYQDDDLMAFMFLCYQEEFRLSVPLMSHLREVHAALRLIISFQKTQEENEIESIIRKQCTAIHPVYEWKLHEVAKIYNNSPSKGMRMPPIIFKDVYPLFGVTDIQDSSVHRNKAIQMDFYQQLSELQAIFKHALAIHRMPYLEQMLGDINHRLAQIETSLSSADEIGILNFIRDRIHPALDVFEGMSLSLDREVQHYLEHVNKDSQIVVEQRSQFDRSVAMINEAISLYLHQEQAGAQNIIPHYFEKHATDGVDHTIYIGQSLLREEHGFHRAHLLNLRIWQMLVMCGCARRVAKLSESLLYPLATTHLILVQDSPMTIRFDYDEKQFVFLNTESVRYKILKKRVEKALIKGTDERLTKASHLSIVYSQESERVEYLDYILHLIEQGYLKGEIEEFELEDVKGVKGLKALRVEIDTTKPEFSTINVSKSRKARTPVEWL